MGNEHTQPKIGCFRAKQAGTESSNPLCSVTQSSQTAAIKAAFIARPLSSRAIRGSFEL
jgi:hypothetical protein